MYHKKRELAQNDLAFDLESVDGYEKKAQVFAIWSDNSKEESENYGEFFEIFGYMQNEIAKNEDKAVLCTDADTLEKEDGRLKIIPAVEGARLIEKDISRIAILREYGVRILTLAHEGVNAVCGAYDTDEGFSDFGFDVVKECEKQGIIIDVSHMSEKSFWDFANVAQKPFLASHSNSFTVCAHPRNITDTQLRTVIARGGIVGVDFVKKHLAKVFAEKKEALYSKEFVYDTVVKHIVHFIEKGSDKNVCFGSDFDGTEKIKGLEKASKTALLGEYLEKNGAQSALVEDLFYNNAYNFFVKNL
jgi:membrane dipeptidase